MKTVAKKWKEAPGVDRRRSTSSTGVKGFGKKEDNPPNSY